MWGLTPKGFKRKRYEDIWVDVQEQARQLFGDEFNLTERSPTGLFFRLVAWFLAVLWELAEKVYYSGFFSKGEGVQLDNLGNNMNIKRKGAQKAATKNKTFQITGDPGTPIAQGFLVATKDDVLFQTTEDVILGSDGIGLVDVVAVNPGAAGNVPANAITEIVKPIAGVSAVTNLQPTEGGRDKESDYEYKQRYEKSLAEGGAATPDSIQAALLSLPNVKAAIVEENDTMETIDGKPPKSVACFVYGGDDEEIAKVIFQKKSGGIQAYGSTLVTVVDKAGNPHLIGFTRVVEVTVYVRIDLTTNSKFPPDGRTKVRTEVIKYIGGTDEDGQTYAGMDIGSDVTIARVIAAAMLIPGIDDLSVELSTDGVNYVSQNIVIGPRQVAATDWQKIEVS
jgi:uncharacterized phage protein gp47/JayE